MFTFSMFPLHKCFLIHLQYVSELVKVYSRSRRIHSLAQPLPSLHVIALFSFRSYLPTKPFMQLPREEWWGILCHLGDRSKDYTRAEFSPVQQKPTDIPPVCTVVCTDRSQAEHMAFVGRAFQKNLYRSASDQSSQPMPVSANRCALVGGGPHVRTQ